MGQSSIHTINKTGYSMFWGSMWDNKIMYNRLFKEGLFLKSFFSLSFNDKISINFLKKFKTKKISTKFYNLNIKSKNFKKYFYNLNKLNCYNSKLWVLRYHNWLILYYFIFISDLKKSLILSKNNFLIEKNFSHLLLNYKKSRKHFYLKNSFNSFSQNIF